MGHKKRHTRDALNLSMFNSQFFIHGLGRVPNSEQSIFNGLKMPKSGKTALNCLTIFQYYLHNLPCFAGDLVYF